jgi:hypothetical protein
MTEQSKIPLPARPRRASRCSSAAEGAFGLGDLKAAPVPRSSPSRSNRRPAKARRNPNQSVALRCP